MFPKTICVAIVLCGIAFHSSGCAPWATDPTRNNPVCVADGAQTKPIVVSDGADGAIVAWIDERGSRTTGKDIYAQRFSEDAQHKWALNGIPICNAAGDQSEVRIVSDGGGGAIIVWKDARSSTTTGTDIYAQRVDAAGAVLWTSNGKIVCNAMGNQEELVAMSDGAAGAYIAWVDVRVVPRKLFLTRVDGDGNRVTGWTENGTVVYGGAEHYRGSEKPLLSGDGSGGVIVAWRNGGSGSAVSSNFFLQRFTANGAPQWMENGVSFLNPTAISNSDCHQLVGTRDGCIGIFDTEFHSCEGTPPANPRLMTQRFSGSSSVVRNWGPPSTSCYTVRTVGGSQPKAVVTSDGADGVVVFLRDEDSYATSAPKRFVAQRLSNTGTRMWTDVGQPVINNSEFLSEIQVYRDVGLVHRTADAVSDMANGGIVVWTDLRNTTEISPTNLDLFAQRVSAASGARMWGENGMAVSTATGNQVFPDAISGDRGGVIVVWQDERRGAENADIYAQRINPDGRYGR